MTTTAPPLPLRVPAAPYVPTRPAGAVRVLVTGAENPAGLAVLRGLRAAGYAPIAAVTARGTLGGRSRAAAGVVRVADPRRRPERFARDLADAAARLGVAAVLPGTEAALLALGRHRDLFPADVAVGAPDPALTAVACDKDALTALAVDCGFAVPPTRRRRVGEDPGTFPAVVKPLRSELGTGDGLARFEVVRVADRAGFDAALAALPDGTGLVQPWIRGPLHTVNGVAWHGEVVTAVHTRAQRTWPVDCGVVSRSTTVMPDRGADAATRALIGRLGWSGIFNLQLIDDGEQLLLIDLNPRPYHSMALATHAGANLPALWTALLLGERVDAGSYRAGVHFRGEDDLRALLHLARSGRPGAALRGLLPRRGTVHAVASWRDPWPLLTLARLALDKAVRPQRMRLFALR